MWMKQWKNKWWGKYANYTFICIVLLILYILGLFAWGSLSYPGDAEMRGWIVFLGLVPIWVFRKLILLPFVVFAGIDAYKLWQEYKLWYAEREIEEE